MYDPDLNGSNNLPKGIEKTRKLLYELAEMEVPVAAELLDTASPAYYGDLLSWGCIGARTVSSQTHRQMASALDLPVGFKNSTDGNISVAVHGVSAAASPHIFPGIDHEGRIAAIHAAGNPYAHVVLRGSESKPNYDSQSITLAQRMLREAELPEYLIVDCSHGNCVGLHEHQRIAFRSAINQKAAGNRAIRGIIMESNLSEGRQNLNENRLKFGVSITDPCLGWEDTEQLVLWGRDRLESIEETPSEKIESLCALE
jgi:3-deoxy-7-phosphoheptulonate synthase